jgi:hypothetical protein
VQDIFAGMLVSTGVLLILRIPLSKIKVPFPEESIRTTCGEDKELVALIVTPVTVPSKFTTSGVTITVDKF